MSQTEKKAGWIPLIEVNLAMLFMSTSGPLGRFVNLPPAVTICVRCLIAAGILAVVCRYMRISFTFRNRRDFWRILCVGVLLVSHWTTYFMALQLANIAVGMLALFTYPVLAALLEPVILRTKLQPVHLVFGILTLIGVALLVPKLDFQDHFVQGILAGLVSALIYVFRNLLLKPVATSYSPIQLMFYQLLLGGLAMSPILISVEVVDILVEWKPLVMLAIITTAVGHTMFVRALRHYTVTSLSIMTTIQPIYGIIMGVVFLSEMPSGRSMIGGAIILSTVVMEGYRNAVKRS